MKRMSNFFILAVTFFCLVGCSVGFGPVNVANKEDGIDYSMRGPGLFFPPPPEAMGRLKVLEGEAEKKRAIAELIRAQGRPTTKNADLTKGKTEPPQSGNYFTGVIINDDPHFSISVSHPELPDKVVVSPNGFEPIFTQQMPSQLVVNLPNRRYKIQKTFIQDGNYAGLNYQYGIRVVRAK